MWGQVDFTWRFVTLSKLVCRSLSFRALSTNRGELINQGNVLTLPAGAQIWPVEHARMHDNSTATTTHTVISGMSCVYVRLLTGQLVTLLLHINNI